MFKLIVRALALGAFFFCVALLAYPADPSQAIKANYGGAIVRLTPPSEHERGGTGFHIQAPSGQKYIVTNAHICAAAEGGYLSAGVPGTDRWISVRVLEVAQHTDLCVVEPLPGAPALSLAASFDANERLFIMGHPLLKALTVTDGFIVAREKVKLLSPPEECIKGMPNRGMETFDTFFGPQEVCIFSVDAYDSSIEIYPGNSGSPVLTASGEVVGTAFAGNTMTNRGAFIPLDVLAAFLSVY